MPDIDFRLERLLFNLDSLAELSEELTSPKDFHRIVRSSLSMIMGNLSTSKGVIFQFDHQAKILKTIASKGIGNTGDLVIKLNEETIKKFIRSKVPIDLKGTKTTTSLSFAEKAEINKVQSRILMPLVVKENFLGLIFIGEKFAGGEYTKDDYKLMSVMAHHIAVSLYSQFLLKRLIYKYDENKQLYDNLSQVYYDTIHAFATAIDAKDAYTKGHSHRVSTYSAAIAKEMKASNEDVEGIRIAGLLHDIGKIAIDRSIINKSSSLTKGEFIELNSHPTIGYEILSKVKFPWSGISKMARSHHERVDGAGYPDRLKNDQIPLGAKIMTLADSFDAMSTNRPYRPALTARKALAELEEHSGKQFDQEIVQSFISLIRREAAEETKSIILPLLSESFVKELKGVLLNRHSNH